MNCWPECVCEGCMMVVFWVCPFWDWEVDEDLEEPWGKDDKMVTHARYTNQGDQINHILACNQHPQSLPLV